MFFVGEPPVIGRRLSEIAYQCMWIGIEQVRPGTRLGDIGHAIQTTPRPALFGGARVLRPRHRTGIPRGPQVLHYGKPGTGVELVAGMTFTIEPMINAGKRHTKLLPDGWTVVTKDHSSPPSGNTPCW
jgi:methionyl aminopeptidase